MNEPSGPNLTRNPILWGAYLACSWTWCIGMFLPALLLRDMGWLGFGLFALPNVIGAMLMGWVIKTRSESVHFVETHAQVIWWFSAITLAFHFYWILWLASFIQLALGIPIYYLAGSIGVVCLFAVVSSWMASREKAPQTAFALLVFSLSVLIGTTRSSGLQEATISLIDAAPQSTAILWISPVMLFGFLLCPYLDITFHHARQQLDSKKKGRLGFTLGFVGFFSLMIFLTTRYAGVIAGAMDGSQQFSIAPWLAAGILIHILCQWFFTVHVHLNRIRTLSGAEKKRALLVVLLVISGSAGLVGPRLPVYAGLSGGEIIYRLFLSAYGLLFPAYMLYRVITCRKGALSWPHVMWIVIALALPMFWMGFIERQLIWLLPGMGVVLLGAIVPFTKRS